MRNNRWHIIPGVLLLLLFSIDPVFGQACCSGGVPFSNNLNIEPVNSKILQIRLIYDYNSMKSLYFETDKLDDDSRKRTTQSIFLHAAYGFTDRFSANIMVSGVRQERRVYSPVGGNSYTKAEGFGDAILFLQYTLVNRGNHTIFSSGGVKIPTGRTNITSRDNGLLLSADLQPGTGSWDGILGITYAYTGFLRPTSTVSVNTIYRINSAAERFNGEQIYEFGDEILATIGIGDQFLIGKLIIEPGLLFRYRHTQPDQIDSTIFPNTGGDWIFISPSLSLNITQNLNLNLSGEIPVYTKLTGTQLSTDYRVALGISYYFDLAKTGLF